MQDIRQPRQLRRRPIRGIQNVLVVRLNRLRVVVLLFLAEHILGLALRKLRVLELLRQVAKLVRALQYLRRTLARKLSRSTPLSSQPSSGL